MQSEKKNTKRQKITKWLKKKSEKIKKKQKKWYKSINR